MSFSFAKSEWNPRRARKGRSTQQLKDLDVERVDGVDKPATGRGFLLFKSEDDARMIQPRMRTSGFAPPEDFGRDSTRPVMGYRFDEPDADERGPADEGLGGDEDTGVAPFDRLKDRSFRGLFNNIVFQAAPNAAHVFALEDQPARQPERGDDRPHADLPERDAIPAAGAGPMYSASGEELFRPAAAARFPDGREWVQKQDDRVFRVSFASILD